MTCTFFSVGNGLALKCFGRIGKEKPRTFSLNFTKPYFSECSTYIYRNHALVSFSIHLKVTFTCIIRIKVLRDKKFKSSILLFSFNLAYNVAPRLDEYSSILDRRGSVKWLSFTTLGLVFKYGICLTRGLLKRKPIWAKSKTNPWALKGLLLDG